MARNGIGSLREECIWTRGIESICGMVKNTLPTKDAHVIAAIRTDVNDYEVYLRLRYGK